MVEEPTLTKTTYQVFQKVPPIWWDEREAITEISLVLALPPTDVRRRLDVLRKMHLIERRQRQTISPSAEIRKVGK